MFQNFCRNFSSTMPISLSEWRVRIGTFFPCIPLIQYRNLIRMKLFLTLLNILADGESKVEPSEKETSPTTNTTTDHQSSSDKPPSNPEKDGTPSEVSSDEQKTPTATADQTKGRLFKGSKKRKHHNQKGRSGPAQSCGAFLSFRCFLKSGASPLLSFLLLVFTTILLLRSGDVELNPGPNESSVSGVSDIMLVNIAEALGDDMEIVRLGSKLKNSQPDIQRYLATNRMGGILTSKGTYQMLVDWRNCTRMQYQRTELREALVSSYLQNVADRYLPQGQVGEHIPTLTEEEISRVADDVKRYLFFELCQIQADPLNSELLLEFERIFTNLTLMEEDKGTRRKTPLLYDNLLKTKVSGFYPKRLLVEGEGGVGKTTLCAKIAWDWIHGIGYQDFKLVLVILLRKATNRTAGEILKSYLSDNNPVTAKQLDKYILTHPDEVFLVLDGLDELAADLDSVQQLTQIILNRLFKSGTVLITSRQWRSDEIRKNPDLRKVYAFIAVEGFSAENLASYITKLFHPDKASSEDLNRFISGNDVIRENMAPFPIYTAMLCIMWKEFDGERRQAMCKLQTFSQLFDEMIGFLSDHYLSKCGTPISDHGEFRSEIRDHLTAIGWIAYQGLQHRRLVFTEEEFQDCPESVNIGCKVGVLTKENRILSRRDRKNYSPSAVSSVQFPHKLFQEYLSGMYLASLYNSNRNGYNRLIADLILRAREYQYILYFTSAQQEEIGLDIAMRLIDSRPYVGNDFIVDVAYESQNPAVAKAVAGHLHGGTLEIRETMRAHTVSGHVFVVKHREVDNLSIDKSCGRTASEDLAEFMSTSPSLRSVTIKKTMHDVFYDVLSNQAVHSKIETLNIHDDLRERPSASRDLAQFICKMPHLKNLTLGEDSQVFLHDDFFSTSASMALSAKIETLNIGLIYLRERRSASSHLAQFICKMPHLKNLTLGGLNHEVSIHDDFYSTSSSMSSSAKIETLDIREDLRERPSASRDLAHFICKMPHLKNLTLGEDSQVLLHDDFYSTSASMASSAKIGTLHIYCKDLRGRASASRDLAQFICKMPHLKNLTLNAACHNDFYLTSKSMASFLKIETLDIRYTDLRERPSASRDLAHVIFKMPHLNNLTLSTACHDDFYSTSASMASSAKIETLNMYEDLRECPSASRDLAQFICKMPNLKNLTLNTPCDDNFYSTSASMASSAKIETLHICCEDLRGRPSASRDLAHFICKMPHLKNLTLCSLDYEVLLHDDFYSTSASMASSAKIETLYIYCEDLIERPSASRDLVKFICKMPLLKNLTLNKYQVSLQDDFYTTSSSMASSAKIETLHIKKTDFRGCPSASRDLAQFICKMPHLKNLTLNTASHDDFYSTSVSMASSTRVDDQSANTCLTLTDLTMNDSTLEGWQDCGSMFDSVQRFTLQVRKDFHYGIIQRIKLPAATELTVQSNRRGYPAGFHKDTTNMTKLSSAITNAFPKLVKLTFSDLRRGNSMMESILQALGTNRSLTQLRIIRFTRCETNRRVDAFIREFNKDQIMKVEIEHGEPRRISYF